MMSLINDNQIITALGNIIATWEPRLIYLLLAGTIIGTFLSRKELAALLKKAGARACVAALLITLAGAALRFCAFPPRHIVFFDEYSHIAIAQSLVKTGRLCEVQQGSIAAPEQCTASPWPGGYHVMLASAFRLAGQKPGTAHALSRLLDTFAIPLAFLTAFGIWGSPLAGLLSAGLLAVSKTHLLFASATETGIASAFCLLAVLAALTLQLKRPNWKSEILLASLTGIAVMVRYENAFLLAAIPALLALRKRLPRSAGFYIICALPLLDLLARAPLLHNSQLTQINAGFAPDFPSTLLGNILFWFIPPYNSPVTGICFVSCLLLPAVRQGARLCGTFFIILVFVASLLAPPFYLGETSRFALGASTFYCLIAGAGMAAIFKQCRNKAIMAALAAALLLAELAGWPGFMNLEKIAENRSAQAAGIHLLLKRAGNALPSDIYIASYAPSSITTFSERKTIVPVRIPPSVRKLALVKDMAWYSMPPETRNADEKALLQNYSFRRVSAMNSCREDSEDNYSLYLLEIKPSRD